MKKFLLLLTCFLIGFEANGQNYDHSYTSECLSEPLKPQYDGGIVENPELEHGLKGWSKFGSSRIDTKVSGTGNKFIVSFQRKEAHASFSQKFNLEKEKLYTFSAWLQVSHGNAEIAAMFKIGSEYQPAGWITAQAGCWSMLKGGVVVNESVSAELYFESKNSSADIWADSISLKPFTQEEWTSHQDHNVEKFRKGKVRLRAVDEQGNPLANAKISIVQKASFFPFGAATNKNILSNGAYKSWFLSRFKYTTFENEMKWASTEPTFGRENYADPDAMISLMRQNGVSVRGHNIFWDDPNFQPFWVRNLNSPDLSKASIRRVNSIVKRYSGQVIHWDVVNENLHFSFLESKLGRTFSANSYKLANFIDRRPIPFLNEFNTIEEPGDGAVTPAKYLGKIRELRAFKYTGPLGIGLEGHFGIPNLAYIRSAIDILASARLPIWVTELDVKSNPNQATFLDQILREVRSHPAVGGIILWVAWRPEGCYRMCLTDNNFRNLPTGNVVDKFLQDFRHLGLGGTTDADGYFEANLYHGDYAVEVSHPQMGNSSIVETFKVNPEQDFQKTLQLKVSS